MSAGRLTLCATVRGDTVATAFVTSTRPVVGTLFAGRSAGFVLNWIPRVFALCGAAHMAAARGALAAAGAPAGARAAAPEDQRHIATEAIREHLWRLMLDWPAWLGRLPDPAAYAVWYRTASEAIATGEYGRFAAELRARLGSEILGAPADEWRRWSGLRALPARASGVAGWLPALCGLGAKGSGVDPERCESGPMGVLPDRSNPLPAHDPVGPFAAVPIVSALWRAGDRIAARVAGRVLALWELADGLASAEPSLLVETFSPAPGTGIANVTTARGILVHRVHMRGDTVLRYDIESPTDRHFAADGPWVRECEGIRCATSVGPRRFLEAAALALDPCVPYAVQIEEAPGEAPDPVPTAAAHA